MGDPAKPVTCMDISITRSYTESAPFYNETDNYCSVEGNEDCYTFVDRQCHAAVSCTLKEFINGTCCVDIKTKVCTSPSAEKGLEHFPTSIDRSIAKVLKKIFHKGANEVCEEYTLSTNVMWCDLKEYLKTGCYRDVQYKVCGSKK